VDFGKKMLQLSNIYDDNPELDRLIRSKQITTASNINRPRQAQVRQLFEDFNERNPRAGGGMLVEPGFGGTRQGYKSAKAQKSKEKSAVKFDKSRVKIPTGEFVGEGRDKSEIFKIKNIKSGSVRYTVTGAGGGKRKLYTSIEDVKKAKLKSLPDELVKVDSKIIKEGIKEVTYKNKKTGKIVKYYKPRVGEAKETIPGKGTTSLKEAEKFIKDYYVRNPKPVRDPTKDYKSKDVRKKSLQETDPTKAKGTSKYNYHHIRQIAGGVPLTTDDVMLINQKINSQLGGETNKALNRISAAIQKNNRLALEAMNAKNEGAALDYMKRVDDLNAQAEKIVNSAIDKLPKKYKGYVGFNQFTLPRDEYGLPISNEPMLIRKVGGMPVSKDAIDLTNLNLKQEQEFRKIVKQQAERGKIGKIDVSEILKDKTRGEAGFVDLDLFKDIGKGAGAVLKAVPTPAGTVGLTAGFGVDPTSAIDRASIAAEAAFAPALVQQAAKFSPAVQRVLNLGLSPQMALRAARIASPIGIASLGAEGAYQLGKFTKDRIKQLREMSPEDREELRRKGDEFAFSEFAAAGGGLAKQAGDRSGAMLRSMNPDSQGLSGLLKRGKKI